MRFLKKNKWIVVLLAFSLFLGWGILGEARANGTSPAQQTDIQSQDVTTPEPPGLALGLRQMNQNRSEYGYNYRQNDCLECPCGGAGLHLGWDVNQRGAQVERTVVGTVYSASPSSIVVAIESVDPSCPGIQPGMTRGFAVAEDVKVGENPYNESYAELENEKVTLELKGNFVVGIEQ